MCETYEKWLEQQRKRFAEPAPVEIPDTVPAEWVEEQAPDRELVPA